MYYKITCGEELFCRLISHNETPGSFKFVKEDNNFYYYIREWKNIPGFITHYLYPKILEGRILILLGLDNNRNYLIQDAKILNSRIYTIASDFFFDEDLYYDTNESLYSTLERKQEEYDTIISNSRDRLNMERRLLMRDDECDTNSLLSHIILRRESMYKDREEIKQLIRQLNNEIRRKYL